MARPPDFFRGPLGLLLLLLVLVLHLSGISLFAKGYFPYKAVISGYAPVQVQTPRTAPFDRLVFVVIDALRSDFCFSNQSSMLYTQSLIERQWAIPFTARAFPPTVTMPRIKALTTGSIPNFLDAILNIAESDTSSTLASQDSWLYQAHISGKRLVMYGDDTWIKLFPGLFDKADGTSSFYVSDFVEVDANVTRHLGTLVDRDWDVMILHYLGLDHIGHSGGPNSIYMAPKQREMDDIIQKIVQTCMLDEEEPHRTLMIVSGDHGMNDAGNHGGSSLGETSTALLFVSPHLKTCANSDPLISIPLQESYLYYNYVEQNDVVPTISTLLNMPIPLNNIGVFIPQLLPYFEDPYDRLKAVEMNAKQLHAVLGISYPETILGCESLPKENLISRAVCLYEEAMDSVDDKTLDYKIELLFEFMKLTQSVLSTASTDYKLNIMRAGIFFIGLSVLITLYLSYRLSRSYKSVFLVASFSALYGTLMFASSYIEEEHLFWYWMMSFVFMIRFCKMLRKGGIRQSSAYVELLQLLGLRLIRSWNQTGQKCSGSPDLNSLFMMKMPTWFFSMIVSSFLIVAAIIYRQRAINLFRTILGLSALAFVVMFKFASWVGSGESIPNYVCGLVSAFGLSKHLIGLARLSFAGILATIISDNYSLYDNFRAWAVHSQYSLLLFLLMQSRYKNVPLLVMFYLQSMFLRDVNNSETDALLTIMLQHVAFFSMGNSNALSSLDLGNVYNGISEYAFMGVSILTFVSNWAGPIWWSFQNLNIYRADSQDYCLRYYLTMTNFHGIAMLALMVACWFLRSHLFIWSVFSPKFLFQIAWCIIQHWIVNISLGGIAGHIASKAYEKRKL